MTLPRYNVTVVISDPGDASVRAEMKVEKVEHERIAELAFSGCSGVFRVSRRSSTPTQLRGHSR